MTMDIEAILKALPHRYPFVLVDRVTAMDIEARTITAIKNVTVNEPYFQGHFPGVPVMPGVLQLEAMAQTGGVLLTQILDDVGITPYFISADHVKFRRVVVPGDQLRIEATITTLRTKVARMTVRCHVGEAVASEAELGCAIGRRDAAP